MAFRTNKVPAIEERTVSGSSVSFNSAFALPLKACKVSFSATQASGTPSPSTPLPISGVSAIGLTANSTPVSVSLGDTRYGGELDVLTGILTVTDIRLNLGQLTWQYVAGCFLARNQSLPMSSNDSASHVDLNVMFDIYKVVSSWNDITINVQDLCGGVYQDQIRIANSNYTDASTFKTAMKDHYVVYQLATPITIQLSANELSSILGNNTFSTDTGTLEITFADLQEKSASGSVATFNTALAMPLSSCNIAVNAWQEGSGEPSPSNVRAIHGFSEVNATRAGKNLANIAQEAEKRKNGESLFTLVYEGSKVTIETSTTASLYVVWGLFQIPKSFVGVTVTLSNSGDGGALYLCHTPNADYSGTITDLTSRTVKTYTFSDSDVGSYLGIRFINATGSDKYIENVQLEIGSTATSYEPYVTPTIYTIQLGQEVYGAEVDVVNGVAHVTHRKKVFDGTFNATSANWQPNADSVGWYYNIDDVAYAESIYTLSTSISDRLKSMTYADVYGGNVDSLALSSSGIRRIFMRVSDTSLTTKQAINEWLALNPITVVYPLATPFDIQLTPQQIETLIGNNTIFADTGDVDLTFKDLDIAKRGSFREVFKLPS